MPRPRVLEDALWEAAARLILPPYIEAGASPCRVEAVTWALIAWRGYVSPGHQALRLLEEYRDWRRGERGELERHELDVLVLKMLEIALTTG